MGLSTSEEKKNWGKCAGGCGHKAIILIKEICGQSRLVKRLKRGERAFICFQCLTDSLKAVPTLGDYADKTK